MRHKTIPTLIIGALGLMLTNPFGIGCMAITSRTRVWINSRNSPASKNLIWAGLK
jgi:hypothetical protein